MAKGLNQVIYKSDLGKALSNGNGEIANYSVFLITVAAGSFKFTYIWSRSGATEFGGFYKSGSNVYYIWWNITLSSNTFSCIYTTHHTLPHTAGGTTGTISQIRGIG